jgi:hypothetical protein
MRTLVWALLCFALGAAALDEALLCSACRVKLPSEIITPQAVVEIAVQSAKTKTPQLSLAAALESLCAIDNFRRFDYPPPKMVTACNEILGQYETKLERYVLKHPTASPPAAIAALCDQKLRLCRPDVAMGKPFQPEVFIDDEPVREL